jgi:hypothetical protein
MSRFLGSRSAPGPDSLSYPELRLWFESDPSGVVALINRMVREGLLTDMHEEGQGGVYSQTGQD